MTKLSEVPALQSLTVSQITGADQISIRLMEMGILPGVELKVINFAPLGDPMEIELRGYRLSLRKSEADYVLGTILDS